MFVRVRLRTKKRGRKNLSDWRIVFKLYYLCCMIQSLVVGLIFLLALLYVGRLVYKSFQAKSSCDSGCGKCGAVDFNKIEKQLREKGM